MGLPGAGKTSLCQWLLQHVQDLGAWHVLHLCYDDYLDRDSYRQQRNHIHTLLNQLIEMLLATPSSSEPLLLPTIMRLVRQATPPPTSRQSGTNYLILCDDNHYYRSMRYKLFQLARLHHCLYAQIHLATPLEVCLLANETREETVPSSVISDMQVRLEAPGGATWESKSLTLLQPNFDANAERIFEFFESLLIIEVVNAQPSPANQLQSQSVIHELDLLLRARIQQLIQIQDNEQNAAVQKAVRSRGLNDKRKQILKEFRKQHNIEKDVHLEYYVNLLN